MDTTNLLENIRRAVSLDRAFYQEAANDERMGQQALLVVIIAAVLSGIGGFFSGIMGGNFLGALMALVVGAVMAVIGYYIWVYVIQFVGAQFFQGRATVPQLLRTLGYAYAPTALGLLSFIPCLGGLVALAGWVWSLVCGFYAVREVHGLDDGKTLLTVIVGWIIIVIIYAIVFTVLGIGALGAGLVFGR
ncbi:MAG: YIP1 family protein [Caldilineaceae bacterium]|nr:YIP1 family protein [Caldilineaceae bacterium]